MNNRIKVIILASTLAGCVAAPPPYQCPNLGVNIYQPDFTQRYDYTTLNSFYTCTSKNIDIAANQNAFGYLPLTPPSSPELDMRHQALDYQWNLWQQIYARQLKPLAAESAWIQFASAQSAQRAQIEAARAAEQAAEEAAQAADDAAASTEQDSDNGNHGHQHGHSEQNNDSSNNDEPPSAPTPQPAGLQSLKWH